LAESKNKPFLGRLIIWLLLVPVTLAAAAAPRWVLAIYALLWIGAASIEYIRMYFTTFKFIHLIFLLSPVTVWLYTIVPNVFPFSLFILIAFLLQIFLWLTFGKAKPQVAVPLLILPFYLGFLPSHFVLIKGVDLENGYSYLWLIFPFLMNWVNDTSAYIFGSLLGKTPLCPRLSPRKTVEGFVCGLLATTAIGCLYWILLIKNMPWWWGMLLPLVIGLAGTLGDLLESAIKRERNVKDTSRMLGGHGGFLDRIDSLVLSVPTYYYLFLLLISFCK
jgi:phosphatidate cytidylyltransferase